MHGSVYFKMLDDAFAANLVEDQYFVSADFR